MSRFLLQVFGTGVALSLLSASAMASQSEDGPSQSAVFLPEFALSPQGSFLEDNTGEQFLTYRYDDLKNGNHPEHIITDIEPDHRTVPPGSST